MTTKQALLKAIEQLPEQQLIEVLQYVQNLSHTQESTLPTESNRAVDPLTEFIGAVSHGSLAASLDNELYGTKLFIDTWGWLTLHDKGERACPASYSDLSASDRPEQSDSRILDQLML